MTSFYVGNEGGLTLFQGGGLMFWTDDLLVCHRHARGLHLQPFTRYDKEKGYGKRGCPFCKGGELEGTFYRYKSRNAVANALDKLS